MWCHVYWGSEGCMACGASHALELERRISCGAVCVCVCVGAPKGIWYVVPRVCWNLEGRMVGSITYVVGCIARVMR